MNAAKATCPGCKKVFTPHGLSQHIAKIRDPRCRPVLPASSPQSRLFQYSLNAQASRTLTANSVLSVHPNSSFGNENPSGHNGNYSDSPDILPGNMDDCKFQLHRSRTYSKCTTAMIVDHASNSADDPANNPADDIPDGDDVSDITNITDADVFEIISQTNRYLELHPTMPDAGQFPSAEPELPLENPPNPLGPSNPDARPHIPVVVEPFPHGNPGAPIDSRQGSSIYESTQGVLGGSVWAPFQSECDWRFAHWAKIHGPSSSALADLLAIPNVCPPFFFLFL